MKRDLACEGNGERDCKGNGEGKTGSRDGYWKQQHLVFAKQGIKTE